MTIGPLLLFVKITLELTDFMCYQYWHVKALTEGVQERLSHKQVLHDGRSIMHTPTFKHRPFLAVPQAIQK